MLEDLGLQGHHAAPESWDCLWSHVLGQDCIGEGREYGSGGKLRTTPLGTGPFLSLALTTDITPISFQQSILQNYLLQKTLTYLNSRPTLLSCCWGPWSLCWWVGPVPPSSLQSLMSVWIVIGCMTGTDSASMFNPGNSRYTFICIIGIYPDARLCFCLCVPISMQLCYIHVSVPKILNKVGQTLSVCWLNKKNTPNQHQTDQY